VLRLLQSVGSWLGLLCRLPSSVEWSSYPELASWEIPIHPSIGWVSES